MLRAMSEIELLELRVSTRWPNVVATAENALLIYDSSPPHTVLVDLETWPPRLTTFANEHVLDADRERTGVWVCQTRYERREDPRERPWQLAYHQPGANELEGYEGLPFGLPDLEEMLGHMEESKRNIELSHKHAIEDIVA